MLSTRAQIYRRQLEIQRRRDALQAFNRLTPEEKIRQFTKEIANHPDHGSLYNNRGNIYLDRNMFDAAIADFTEALKRDGHSAIYYNNRASAYKGKRMLKEAIEDYNNAIIFDQTIPDIFINRGITYYELKKYDRAIQDMSDALDLNNRNIKAYFTRGKAYQAKKMYAEAIADFNKALELDPNNKFIIDRLVITFNNIDINSKLDTISKTELFSAIRKIPVDNQVDFLNQSKKPETAFGMRFWKQEGFKSCSLEKGTLKQIDDYLQTIDPTFEGEELKQFRK